MQYTHYITGNAGEILMDIMTTIRMAIIRRGWKSDWKWNLILAGGNVKWCRYFGEKF